jgi:hypothetical protein
MSNSNSERKLTLLVDKTRKQGKRQQKTKHVISLDRRSNLQLIAKGMPVFPLRSKPTYLVYSENFSLNTGAAATGSYLFAANGLYDPNITGTGHQPSGFDQMMLFYFHYTVLRSRMTAYVRNTSSTYNAFAGISYSGTNAGVTNEDTNIEKGLIDFKALSTFPNAGYHIKLERAAEIKAGIGADNLLDFIDSRGDVSNNPVELEYFVVNAWNPDTADVVALRVTVVIEFEVVFTEPRAITGS